MRELERAVGVQARTLRHWIRLKLLPKPLGRGRGARYMTTHVARANAIRRLRSERLSTPAIRARLTQLTEEQMAAMRPPVAPDTEAPREPPPEPSYPFISWESITLIDGLVLLVSRSRGAAVRRIADEIYRYYGARTS
ncbi:MAG TPA: MerR family transcriptional regulator [Polyangiaceae bacterium]|nr:MerR family transcriptional regulator [Polyangiaceae bacterium]